MANFAGHDWGYSGSTETSLTLCPSGVFLEASESSYSGSSRDSLGNQTGAWGVANQRGARGNWSIQGDGRQGTIQFAYPSGNRASAASRQAGAGCYSLNGRTLCRKGPAHCQ